MIPLRKLAWILLFEILLVAASYYIALARSPEDEIPPGFHLVSSTIGVQLYRKDYPNGNPDFVQVVNLSQGGAVKLMVGELRELRAGKGVFGGDDPRIQPRSLEQFWHAAATSDEAAFCVTNGAFFYMKENPTRLPFPLKKDGAIVSDGYAKNEFEGQKLMLEIWEDRADIVELSSDALYTSSAPDILGGLHEDANKSSKNYVGRTFVGVMDGDQDGSAEIILIFNTQSARQSDAAKVLRGFGADQVMMLDGGGSTQLTCQGKAYISSDRLIPQAIAVLGADVMRIPPRDQVLHAQVEGAQRVGNSLEQKGIPDLTSESSLNESENLEVDSSAISALGTIDIKDVVWVPITLASLAVFFMITILRIQHVK